MASIISKKICMLGDFSVGKTSLIRRFVERQFSDQYLSTVGVKISRKTVECNLAGQQKQVNVQMLIWDLEGNTKFKAITPMHLQGATSAVIVADVRRQATIDHIPNHVQSFLSVNPKGFIIVALNKTDLFEDAQLVQMIKCLPFKAEDQVIAIYPTSAKTGAHVDEIFNQLAYKMIAPP
ncbi:MAG TPA: Rab family GTPase [Coleofasciculaceae cyanobacterium]|jgi:small GTP-binding protein